MYSVLNIQTFNKKDKKNNSRINNIIFLLKNDLLLSLSIVYLLCLITLAIIQILIYKKIKCK
ncbi:hypothetical protein IOLA_005 [uncultured bacterium]|nr:hypothetical protein IOLA_005 [uncultured bacterium]